MVLSRVFPALVALALSTICLSAAESVSIWTQTELTGVSTKLASNKSAKSIEGVPLGAFGSQSCSVFRRTASGEAELHKVKTDYLIIEQGNATLVYGGTIPNARTSAPNEVRGSSISGGGSKAVSAGDIIRIPPGTPHQFVLAKGQTVSYFALKVETARSATMQ